MSMQTRSIVATIGDPERRTGFDDLIAVLRRERLQFVLDDDEVLTDVLDTTDRIPTSDLAEVGHICSCGQLAVGDEDVLAEYREVLLEFALLLPCHLRLLARDPTLLVFAFLKVLGHRLAVDGEFVGLHHASDFVFDRR